MRLLDWQRFRLTNRPSDFYLFSMQEANGQLCVAVDTLKSTACFWFVELLFAHECQPPEQSNVHLWAIR